MSTCCTTRSGPSCACKPCPQAGQSSRQCVCGPPGFQNARVFLNDAAKESVAALDREAIMTVVRKARDLALSAAPERVEQP